MKLFQLERQARRLTLPRTQKAVLVCLISYSNKNGDGTQIYPGITTIALECSISERHAKRCLKLLEQGGWIVAIYRKGGAGRPSSYYLNLDQFGWLEARPPAPAEEEPMEPARRLIFARGVLKRLAADSPARPRWEQEIAELEAELGQPPASDLVIAPADTPELIPFMAGNDLLQLEAMYTGWIMLQAREPPESDRYQWYQDRIDKARIVLNQEFDIHGVVAPDGLTPVLSQELQEQMQAWSRKVEQYLNYRNGLTPGSKGWLRWDTEAKKATEALNSFFISTRIGGSL